MSGSAMRIVHAAIFFVTAVFASVAARAADLSSDDIKRWAESTRSVQSWAERQAPAFKDQMEFAGRPQGMQAMMGFSSMTPEQMQALAAPMSSMVKGVRAAGMGGEFSTVIAGHGFSSPDQWGALGDRVMKAYMTMEISGQGDPRAEMAETMAELQGNPHMSDAQKAQMMAMMQGSMKMLELMANAPPEDVEAVRPHKSLLRNAFSD